jgi:hypothetical protein
MRVRKRIYRPPDIDIRNLKERKLLEAELLSIDMQVRNFGRVRDRLSAAGKDGTPTIAPSRSGAIKSYWH